MKFKKGSCNIKIRDLVNGGWEDKLVSGWEFQMEMSDGNIGNFLAHKGIDSDRWTVTEVESGAKLFNDGFKTRKEAVENVTKIIQYKLTRELILETVKFFENLS